MLPIFRQDKVIIMGDKNFIITMLIICGYDAVQGALRYTHHIVFDGLFHVPNIFAWFNRKHISSTTSRQ